MVDLSIVYLIIVSGFHLAIIKRIINIIFKKRYAIANLVSTTIIFVYLYFLNFAVSAFRVFSTLILSIFLRRRCNSPYEILGLSGLISLLLGPSIAFNAGFCLSYLCTAGIIFIGTLNINNIFLEKVLINLIAIVISLPFVLTMNRYISFWVLFNSFIFAYFFCFIFLALLFTFWIVWFLPLQDYITSGAWWLIKIALVNNIKIYINPFAPWVEVIYYQAIFLTIILINYHYHDD
ncbi:MAG: ComEC/Rec2 family competence protein [Mycoplasmataceae bacterium]|nr:ComEC/Rec2 family competence protein [Mycoplasmataceae bacterium]